ncbi:hypothetical protein FISHEDRAFT_41950 [Fistulina hepatica ATCC 64428]|uniref:Uncharacterized protein n=1 Tax=Fistulina hepatica ATCC 64428 TaxID=1128425 RepID=A0A0D7ADV0_9AGAR|nr:hypothetical protein FISHEDRAFT_41950 [Fistulina hepatica ATCC 64428]
MSHVGTNAIHSDGDQQSVLRNCIDCSEHTVGVENSHDVLDSKDQRSIANRLAAAEEQKRHADSQHTAHDPTRPARDHGNEPSRGAQIDAEIQREEAELLERKRK